MVTEIVTKLSIAKRKGKHVIYRSPRIYLPTKLTDDSLFPFKEGDKLKTKITGHKLIVEKIIKKTTKRKLKSKKMEK
jgi:hypothetical protein